MNLTDEQIKAVCEWVVERGLDTKWVNAFKEDWTQRKCKHHPFDRDDDDFGRIICTECNKIIENNL